MSFELLVEDHHKLTYANNVQMVAQQKQNPLRAAVTTVTCTGEAHSVADLIGTTEYLRAEERSRRNPENPPERSRRWLVRPLAIETGQYLDREDKWDMAMDPSSHLMSNTVTTVERGVFDTILGIQPKEGASGYEVSATGILGNSTSGKRRDTTAALPSAQYIAHNFGSGGTGLSLDKIREVKKTLNIAEFGMEDDDTMYWAITPTQVDDLIGLAAATSANLNPFAVDQLKSGKVTELLGFTWIPTNRLPVDSNGYRLCPTWSKRNVVLGFWQDVQGQMWNDTHAKNLPYMYASAVADCVRIEDAGVMVTRCEET